MLHKLTNKVFLLLVSIALSLVVLAVLSYSLREHSTLSDIKRLKVPYLTSQVLLDITRDPNSIKTYYQQFQSRFDRDIGPEFNDVNSDGKKLIFANIVAYRLKPYGKSNSVSLSAILSDKRLNCFNYPKLAAYLFQILAPQSRVQLYFVGWNGGAVGNHAQMFATYTGIPLLIDPTIALTAKATFNQIAMGNAMPTKDMISAYSRNDIDSFNHNVLKATHEGLYKPSDLLYYEHGLKRYNTISVTQHWATPQYENIQKIYKAKM